MWIPFARQITATFESDRPLAVKLLVGALAGLAVGANLLLSWLITVDRHNPIRFYFSLFVGGVALTTSLVLVLALKDVIKKRAEAGDPVNPFFRLLFISGYLSLAIWILLAFVGSFLFAIYSV